jgi:hypothetical protein
MLLLGAKQLVIDNRSSILPKVLGQANVSFQKGLTLVQSRTSRGTCIDRLLLNRVRRMNSVPLEVCKPSISLKFNKKSSYFTRKVLWIAKSKSKIYGLSRHARNWRGWVCQHWGLGWSLLSRAAVFACRVDTVRDRTYPYRCPRSLN